MLVIVEGAPRALGIRNSRWNRAHECPQVCEAITGERWPEAISMVGTNRWPIQEMARSYLMVPKDFDTSTGTNPDAGHQKELAPFGGRVPNSANTTLPLWTTVQTSSA